MSYQAEISRANPSCFVFLIDQSGSMSDPFGIGEATKKKADGVADAVNRLLQNLVIKCAKSEGVRDYYHVGVIGYGSTVGSGFAGNLGSKDLAPISLIANSPTRIEERTKKVVDGAGGLIDQTIKFPIWFDPAANGGTPMSQALAQAKTTVQEFLSQHPSCFPPIVINITDGEATDGNPTDASNEIRALASTDGNVLLFNVHLSSQKANAIEFPDSENGLPDEFARLLFGMSSSLPSHIQSAAKQEGYNVSEASRGFVFNADIVSVIRFLDIGTRPSNLR
jgi:hypothetical protein